MPNSSQQTALENTLELCRWTYNETLSLRKKLYEKDKQSVSLFYTQSFIPKWKNEKPELKTAHSQVLQNVCVRVDLAFEAFFRRIKSGDTPGYPKFKEYGQYNSFTFPQGGFKIVDNNKLRLSKIGDVKIKLHRPIDGKIKTLTIRRDRTDKWYACFSVIVEPNILPPTEKVVGVDLGLTTFAYLSDGNKIERQRWMKQDEKDIKRIQRKIDRFPVGSNEREKAIKALNKAYQRVTNKRTNFTHQESRKLINEYQIIAFEKLDIRNMSQNTFKTISRGIEDVAWGRFVQFATYKAEETGRLVIGVDPKNTTQECSGCGKIVKKDLSVRVHDCHHCGLKLDRDLNAAKNILRRGLASLEIDNDLIKTV